MHMLSAGDPAPDFSLQDQDGNPHTLADYAGRQLLIYFYPRADTPGCTKQSCSVRDHVAELAAKGIAALGVSPDGPAAQKRFDDKFSLGFPLLCDTERAMIDAYGAWGERTVFGKTGMGLIRSAFLVGADGTLRGAWSPVTPDDTVPNALAAAEG
jgi:peroxiredoxin Q/BCP